MIIFFKFWISDIDAKVLSILKYSFFGYPLRHNRRNHKCKIMECTWKIVILIFILNVRNSCCSLDSKPTENEVESDSKFSLENDKLSLEYLLKKCKNDSSLTCVQRNIYKYFDNVLNLETINVTTNVILKRNDISYGDLNESESNYSSTHKFTITGKQIKTSFWREKKHSGFNIHKMLAGRYFEWFISGLQGGLLRFDIFWGNLW